MSDATQCRNYSLADEPNKLYVYPIKSLRSAPLQTATLTSYGFPHDRRFMLVKQRTDESSKPRSKSHFSQQTQLENMTITYYPELSLFLQTVATENGVVNVEFRPPDGAHRSLEIPLEPSVNGLECVDITLHKSPTQAYAMDDDINTWFSQCLGFSAKLLYLGAHRRPVLGNLSPSAATPKAQSWFSSMTNSIPNLLSPKAEKDPTITFSDVAAYLVVTEESLQDVSSRLPEDTEMDITKFRPNIVVSGANAAYDEDYWARIAITSVDADDSAEIILTQNCARCVSINVDYTTGQPAKGEEGQVLKKMMKDRRIDKGAKWSPIFGRYGFLDTRSKSEGLRIGIGDEVAVKGRNSERTTFGEWINSC